MSYADLTTDVLPRIPAVQALRDAEEDGLPATQPSLTQAGSLLAQVEAEIDMHLRARGIETPVTDDEAAAFILPIAAVGAGAAILFAAFPHSEGIGGSGGAGAELRGQYADMLKAIDDGLMDHDMGTDAGACTVSHGFHSWHHPLGCDDWRR
jgi:hypothetical protein